MKTSKEGLDLIKFFEGFRSKPYKCPAGVWTIGYGTTKGITKHHDPISEEEALQYLISDLAKFEKYVVEYNTNPKITQQQFDALVSFTYNLGPGSLRRSSVLRHHNLGNYSKAADSFLLWNKAGGKVLKGLVVRRQKERDLYLRGSDDKTS
jgi:lysozyme